jgi:hypothetical protein
VRRAIDCSQAIVENVNKNEAQQRVMSSSEVSMCSVEDVSRINVLRAASDSKATVTLRFGKYQN